VHEFSGMHEFTTYIYEQLSNKTNGSIDKLIDNTNVKVEWHGYDHEMAWP
jgi:hypothetical protein